MKSITTINDEIKSLEEEAAELKLKIHSTNGLKYTSLEMNRMKKRFGKIEKDIVFFRQLKRYLETNPTRDFLVQEEVRLKTRYDLIEKQLPVHYQGVKEISKEQKAEFYKLMGVRQIKSHLKNIRFLLSVN